MSFQDVLAGVTFVEILGYLGSSLSIATYAMKTMIPLRIAGMLSSTFFIIYGVSTGTWPVVFMEATLLPLNGFRLWQMVRLVRKVRAASEGDLSMRWLEPFSARKTWRAGETIFRRDDPAEEMFFVLSGRYRLAEAGIELGTGQVVGEIGLVSEGNRRTQTLLCIEGGEVLSLAYEEVRQLYAQNPEFGFYFLRLVSARMLANARAAEERAAALERRLGLGHAGNAEAIPDQPALL